MGNKGSKETSKKPNTNTTAAVAQQQQPSKMATEQSYIMIKPVSGMRASARSMKTQGGEQRARLGAVVEAAKKRRASPHWAAASSSTCCFLSCTR